MTKSIIMFFKDLKSKWFLLALAGLLASRAFVLNFPPLHYSDVSHDYERYANMWHYGYPPYFKHFYEYPPATIPLLWVPLMIDQMGVGTYYLNYRVEIFLLDILLFLLIFKLVARVFTSPLSRVIALLFYLIAPMVAKDFFYEGIDLAFIGSLTAALIFSFLLSQKKFLNRVLFWSLFWLSTAIKFMSLPLIVPYFYLRKMKWKKEVLACILGFFIIWGIPLVIFRSALSVSFVFHAQRHLKYASFPSFIVETVNQFTDTEMRIDEPPDFQLAGPVSNKVEQAFDIIFPLSIILFLLYSLIKILKPRSIKDFYDELFFKKERYLKKHFQFALGTKITLIYIFTLFLTGTIFSQPFHIWYLPLIAVFPFKKVRIQLIFMALVLCLLIMDTTPWIRFSEDINPFTAQFLAFIGRFLPMILLLFLSFSLQDKSTKKL